MELEQVWKDALAILQKEVTAVSFDLWLKSLEPISYKNNTFYLSTTSETAKNRVVKLHATQIKLALKEVDDNIEQVNILDPDEKENFLKEEIIDKEDELLKSTYSNLFNPKYTFDSFVVGNSNKYVYAACKGVAESPFTKINPLFIYGGVGLGKTHLLHAIGNYINSTHPEYKIIYVTSEKFINDYVTSLKSKNFTNYMFRDKYRNLDILMVDDIQFISKAKETQEEFFHTFNDLYQNNKQIIIASDRPPKDISTLEERLRSRFSMGIIQDIQFPEYETRLAILQKKTQQENYHIDDKVLSYIAENCDTNIREMEGILSKISFYASLLGKEKATMEDVSEALKDHDFSNKENLTTDRIIDCVCKFFSISKNDLLSKKKNKEIVEPRQICMYVIYDLLDLPLNSIGQVFGGKDHTTVIHACRKVESMIKENNRIKIAVNDIKSMASKL